ncbi:unnamed protein product [Rotaria magnacalcarata]|uniref:Uncharacterized protein n=1 Tax=Rotaria magnacalcarata TaxID=392030 RepID=A0A817ADD7_9BILA|nr:unnamed protein product [Rotaria magnacalcarata]
MCIELFPSIWSVENEVNDDPVYSDSIDLKDLNEVKITSVKREPPQSMKVGISAVKSAVRFFKNVIQLPINCFSISDLTYNRIFYNYKRDNIDVKAILSNLEKKCLLKHGKFLKVGSRSIDSWIKILSVPTNDEEIHVFRNELNNNYQLGLDKYIDLYKSGTDHKSSLSETKFTTDSITQEIPQAESAISFASSIIFSVHNSSVAISIPVDVFQDIIDSTDHNPINLRTTCLNTTDSIEIIQQMNFSPIVESCNDKIFYIFSLR